MPVLHLPAMNNPGPADTATPLTVDRLAMACGSSSTHTIDKFSPFIPCFQYIPKYANIRSFRLKPSITREYPISLRLQCGFCA